ncbi:conserved Plasmodium protein, unknown function [Plasmodium gallinaceum]|uniref:Metallo-beta-lactamase domain-containing protein n=1 Tax=Plasmodium gallinaceum TaxID=5849 RepID=A0A1J1GWS8_PLAGA|nr:conserved Plasmodium protein, unknown function [Plasmodium gallinaceum]CRG97011.1 conserved Plasmodium protein, unknown function [Plasmodium gallinaceum]
MIKENGIIFLGTGGSSSTPKLSHVFKNSKKILNKNKNSLSKLELKKEDYENIDKFVDELASKSLDCIDELNNLYLKKLYSDYPNMECYTCFDALNNDSKNKRNNISLLLKSNNSYVLIDVGKTFRDNMVLISHSHTDALNGIDDLRDLQDFNKTMYDDLYYYTPKKIIDIYLNEVTYERLLSGYAYLAQKRSENIFYSKIPALNIFILKDEKYNKIMRNDNVLSELKEESDKLENNIPIEKDIDRIDEKKINKDDDNTSVNIHTYDLKDEYGFIYSKFDNDKIIRFIPFEHGKNYICVGYIIGKDKKLVYISDCSNLSSYILNYIKNFEPIEILIIDALFYTRKHYSHFSLHQSIKIALLIKPKKVYFVGMSCAIEHNITNLFLQKLSKKYPDTSFSLAHDGLFIPFDF